jgi:P pilus assembly chaperone PapD
MKCRILPLFILPLLLLSVSIPVLAGIAVSPVQLILDQDHKSRDFSVFNQDPKKIAYVSISIEQADKSATSSTRKVLNDPRKTGLLISPTKLALPPGGSRTVRISLIRHLQAQEQRYMLVVAPQEGELTMAKSPSDENLRAAIHVIVAYGIEVMVAPLHPNTKLSLSRTGREITASNQGNTIVVLYGKQQCASPNQCEKFEGRYEIAPGTTQKIIVPKALPATFRQRVFEDIELVESN